MADEDNLKEKAFQFNPPSEGGVEDVEPSQQNNTSSEALLSEAVHPSVITVDNVKYAVGLFWQPLQDIDDPIPEVRETMEADVGTNLYALHYGRAPQYGIAKQEKGHKEGLFVGSIAVQDALSDRSSFVAVFKVPEGWWFLVVRNDLILPEEDVLYQTEEEAKDAFYSMMAVPDWGYKIAPPEWGIDDVEDRTLEDLLNEGMHVKLSSLSAIRGTKVLLIITLLLSGLIALAVYAVVSLIDTEKKEAVTIAPVAPTTTFTAVEPQREEEKPWEKLVNVPEFLQRCWSSSYQLKAMQVPGWSLNQIVCTPEGIKTGWNKSWQQGGRVAWIEKAIHDQYQMKGDIQINQTGTAATAFFKFEDVLLSSSIPTLKLARLRREMVDISQAISLPISLTDGQISVEVPQPLDEGSGQNTAPVMKNYAFLAFSFSSPMDPPAWEGFFNKFNGLEITKIEYNPQSDSAVSTNWKYEGRIYEKEK